MNAVVQFLPSATIYLWLTSMTPSVDMCDYVTSLAGLINGELETFGRKLS